jgi:hypothetical protein
MPGTSDVDARANFAVVDAARYKNFPSLSIPASFNLQSVDARLSKTPGVAQKPLAVPTPGIAGDVAQKPLAAPTPGIAGGATEPPPSPPTGVLRHFKGKFAGPGFNTIFRPSGPKNRNDPTQDPELKAQFETPPNTNRTADDNLLELNLTQEVLEFSTPLGKVPNRGLDGQKDVTLLGVSYIQSIEDVTNPLSGLGDKAKGRPIHFEPGLFLQIPKTTAPSSEATIARLASIPHGTTFTASGFEPSSTEIAGAPNFLDEKFLEDKILTLTTPFGIPTGPPLQVTAAKFPALRVEEKNRVRLPQKLGEFDRKGPITDKILEKPFIKLQEFNEPLVKANRIKSHYRFTVDTDTTKKQSGSPGISNIPFLSALRASPFPGAETTNADAVRVQSTFWILAVEYDLNIKPTKAFKDGDKLEPILPLNPLPGANGPQFIIKPATDIVKGGRITVVARHIQYFQDVTLNFALLSWPHISVASLVPITPVEVPLEKLKTLT